MTRNKIKSAIEQKEFNAKYENRIGNIFQFDVYGKIDTNYEFFEHTKEGYWVVYNTNWPMSKHKEFKSKNYNLAHKRAQTIIRDWVKKAKEAQEREDMARFNKRHGITN